MKKPMNEERFLEAYDRYADAIFRHCFFRVHDHEKAKDLTQETFMRAWEYLAEGKQIENIRAFLYRVATNLVIDDSRRKKTVSLDVLQEEKGFDPGADTTGRTEQLIDAKGVMPMLKKLDPHHRQVVVMRYIDGLGPKEIANILGESENNVSVRLHRAMIRLRSMAAAYE